MTTQIAIRRSVTRKISVVGPGMTGHLTIDDGGNKLVTVSVEYHARALGDAVPSRAMGLDNLDTLITVLRALKDELVEYRGAEAKAVDHDA